MSQPPADAYQARRRALLAGVAAGLGEVGIGARFEPLERYYDFYGALPYGVTGLVVRQPAGSARMQVTAASVRRILPPGEGGLSADGHVWVRDLDVDYNLDGGGDVVFEVTTLEDPDAGLGHSRATSAMRRLTREDQAVVDAVRLWYGYRESLRCLPPAADPGRRRARLIRQLAARRSAAAMARVRVAAAADAVPPQQRPLLAAHLAQLDHSLLCFHFPRDPNGRYAKRAVVALTGYGAGHGKRGPWLAVRADGDTLVTGVEELIGDNQDHRWDNSPWLWNTTHRNASTRQRWQLPGAAHARPS
ncbi:MAG: hypothetical protein J2P26_00665 [Nocardiopsaceae bacterium]|nr:hypothetical protein [Nocardiopsaceae bacterium]